MVGVNGSGAVPTLNASVTTACNLGVDDGTKTALICEWQKLTTAAVQAMSAAVAELPFLDNHKEQAITSKSAFLTPLWRIESAQAQYLLTVGRREWCKEEMSSKRHGPHSAAVDAPWLLTQIGTDAAPATGLSWHQAWEKQVITQQAWRLERARVFLEVIQKDSRAWWMVIGSEVPKEKCRGLTTFLLGDSAQIRISDQQLFPKDQHIPQGPVIAPTIRQRLEGLDFDSSKARG
ncbi:uncharacterized protein EI97DRAFT_441441 [Westerdykella ornata]|uniref:Uncharacterized protein n=1 Tax=Westerdykella ornata TaxID=318751 RepID=A0A6A6JLJ6_WESOR|nr:uncharacterized protein EI97DRAFT_441441 [Westerdykella ornata]KAF2277377.1 hypothetical protein EI97DRAFT_441441 [Westerdykella ornata]